MKWGEYMTNEILLIDEQNIKNKIYIVRGKQVMVDSDLAKIYGYETKNFNRQVKNNIEKFDNEIKEPKCNEKRLSEKSLE